MFILRQRACTRPVKSALLLLAAVALIVSTILLTSAPPTQAAIAGPFAREVWASDLRPGADTALAHIGSTAYIGGDFSALGRPTALRLLDPATGQPLDGLPQISGEVSAALGDGSGGWFIGGSFTVTSASAFANLVHIKADKTLDTAWNPQAAAVRCLSRNSTTLFASLNSTSFSTEPLDRAVDIKSGRLLNWKPDLQGLEQSASNCPAVNDDTVFLVAYGSPNLQTYILAADARTGQTRWKISVKGVIKAMVVHGSTLYLTGSDEIGIGAIDIPNGRRLPFKISIGQPRYEGEGSFIPMGRLLVLQGDRLYIAGNFEWLGSGPSYGVGVIALPSGTVLPWHSLEQQIVGVHGNHVYFTGYAGGFVRAVDATSMETVWYRIGFSTSAVNTVSAGSAGLLVGGRGFIHRPAGPNLAALDLSSGASSDWRPRPDGAVTELAASDTALYAAGVFGQIGGQARPGLAAFDHPSGALRDWNPQPNGPVSALLVGGGRLYVAGGFSQIAGQARPGLAAFDLASGALSDWTPAGLPAGSVTALVLGPDALYVTVEEPHEPLRAHNATFVALDPASGAAGWSTTLVVQELYDLAVYGTKLYASGSIDYQHLAVFDTRGAGPPQLFFRVGGFPNKSDIEIHDQTLYLGVPYGIRQLDLDSTTPVAFGPGGGCTSAMADVGTDLLVFTCGGWLVASPYTSTPFVETGNSYGSTTSSITFKGKINPNDAPTSAFFQVTGQPGSCDALQTLPVSGILTGTRDVTVSVTLDNLPSGATYSYRLVATYASGVVYGDRYQASTIRAASTGAAEPAPAALAAPARLPAPAEATPAPAWQVFLPSLRRCPTDGF